MTASRLPSAGGPCVCLRADLADSGCTEVVAAPAEMVVPAAASRYAVWLVKKRSAWRQNGPKWPKNVTTSGGRFAPNQQLPGPLTHVSQAPMMSTDWTSRAYHFLRPHSSGVGPFLQNIAENQILPRQHEAYLCRYAAHPPAPLQT